MSALLGHRPKVERLKAIKARIDKGETFTAFDLAVEFCVSIDAVYLDVKTLKAWGMIPVSFVFARRAY